MGLPAPSLKVRALRLLSRREHSRAELSRKLARHLEADDEASRDRLEAVLDELAAKGLLSEQRTADAVVARGATRFGERRLRQDLIAKGLSPELVASTLDSTRGTELDRAREVWRRRFGTPAADAGERARQARFLAGRGFTTEVIFKVVKDPGDSGR
jgi:regulatory protein